MVDIGIIKFQIADIHFGMFADRILEIVRLERVRPIPRPLPYVVGLTELRNYIVTIVDFRKRLGLSPIHLDRGTIMIAVKLSFGVIGLLVESISNFKRVAETEILSPFSIAGLPAQLLQGILAADEDIMIIPDLNKILLSYIPMQLSSITSSEKIAFQYRSTPGAIGRTLENTLVSQGYLDDDIILKLPRSMSLPSVQVHKFISYYPDFQPRKKIRAKDESASGTHQQTRAGDESYTSLSKRLENRQQNSYTRSAQHAGDRVPVLPFKPQQDFVHAFEEILQSSTGREQQMSPQRVLSDRELGRHIAKTFRVAPVQLTKYFTYYPQSSATSSYPSSHDFFTRIIQERQRSAQALSLDERLNELLRHSRYKLEEVLQTLEKEGYTLQRKALRRIGEHYQVSQVGIARLAGNFPELQFDLAIEKGETRFQDDGEDTTRAQQQVQTGKNDQTRGAEAYQKFKSPVHKLKAETANLNACLQYLATQEYLDDDHAVRYVAVQLSIATCRLSKLRSYYQFREK
ncbi:MAG: purine-binding chemotaxis protein CheW [bacterium]|nr:purine-binding chemotaxis protein CheW [bacterium]